MTSTSEWAQWRGLLQLAGEGFDEVTLRVQELHAAIARVPFRQLDAIPAVNAGAALTEWTHDGISSGVYALVRTIGKAAFQASGNAMRLVEPQMAAPATSAARLRDGLASAAGGIVGDHMARRRNPAAPRMSLRLNGRSLQMNTDALRAAYPQAGSRVALFVHGLCCDEHSWRLYSNDRGHENTPYGTRLEREHGYNALYLRYNSGQSIASNARQLARLLDALDRHWPCSIDTLTLIGHSMGGLLIRAAAAEGLARGSDWARRVDAVICLGSPHLGAPLEKLVHAGIPLLQQLELTKPFARVLEWRSIGIRDLRHGSISAQDRRQRRSPPSRVARLPQARYHFIGSSVGRSDRDLLGQVLGDGLVRLPSALARNLADADSASLFRIHHMRLLNDARVWAVMRPLFG